MPDQTTKTIIVGAGLREVFEAWSNFENFPSFMKNVESVTKRPDGSTHWVLKGPLGKKVEWDAEITMFEPGKRIGWRSSEGSATKTSGQVTFLELGTGQTQVNVTAQWVVPASEGGETLAGLMVDPEGRVEEGLNNFKAYVEGRKAMV